MKIPGKTEILKVKKEYLIVGVAVGVALMLLSKSGSLVNTSSDSGNSMNAESDMSFGFSYDEDTAQNDYLTYTSEQIKKCLQKMEGVGETEVFLTVQTSSDSYMGNDMYQVQGVMIVAEGADDPLVVKEITEVCEALFSLDAHKIKVVRMKEENK